MLIQKSLFGYNYLHCLFCQFLCLVAKHEQLQRSVPFNLEIILLFECLVTENVLRVNFPAVILLTLQLIHLDSIDGPHIDRIDVIVYTVAEDPDHHTNATGLAERNVGNLHAGMHSL